MSTDAALASAPGDVEERSAVSVFIAPVSQRPLLAALTDLSGAGLIAPFHWVESAPDAGADAAGRAADPALVSVRDGRVSASRYSRVVNRHALRTVRLLIVVPVGHPDQDALSSQTELYFHGLGITSTARRECTRVLVPWSARPLAAELGRSGWNNVMLSPEATADPAYSPTPWWEEPECIRPVRRRRGRAPRRPAHDVVDLHRGHALLRAHDRRACRRR